MQLDYSGHKEEEQTGRILHYIPHTLDKSAGHSGCFVRAGGKRSKVEDELGGCSDSPGRW